MHENIPSDRKPEIGMLEPWQRFISRFFTRWIEHDHSTSAAAIAFYVIFSLAPIVVFSISIAGQILENDAGAREMASEFLDNAMGQGYGKAIVDQVKMSAFRKATIIPTAFLSFIERDEKVGGLLRYGIPDFKLEKHIIDRRVEILR